MAKFDHVVNYNGVYYKAGEEVPIDEVKVDMPEPIVEAEQIEEPKEETETPKRRRRSRKE